MNVCVKQRFHMAFRGIDQVRHQSGGVAASGIRDRKMIRFRGGCKVSNVCETEVLHRLPWGWSGGTPGMYGHSSGI